MSDMAAPIRQLADREPVVVQATDSLRLVAETLYAQAVGSAVVLDDGGPTGIVSERDVVAALARGRDPDATPAKAFMTPYVISARPDDQVFDVVIRMIDAEIRHMPVIDERDVLCGVVSSRDLLRPLLITALGG